MWKSGSPRGPRLGLVADPIVTKEYVEEDLGERDRR
jgi:hypothetical protein